MNKQEFLMRLREGLSGLPQNEIEERLTFYSEMIDDRIEEGLSEEQAIGEIGDIDEIISQIVADIPLAVLVKEKVKPSRKLRVWEIVLLILGSPIMAFPRNRCIFRNYCSLCGNMVGNSFLVGDRNRTDMCCFRQYFHVHLFYF